MKAALVAGARLASNCAQSARVRTTVRAQCRDKAGAMARTRPMTMKLDQGAAIAAGQETIRSEARALDQLCETLAGALSAPFADAVSLLANAKGRVIVSGMGKSGHIARKIAATLASTGTPAQ